MNSTQEHPAGDASSEHARADRAGSGWKCGSETPRAAYLGAGLGVEGDEGVLDGADDLLRRRALPRPATEEEGHLAAGRRKQMDRGAPSLAPSVLSRSSYVPDVPMSRRLKGAFPSLAGGGVKFLVRVPYTESLIYYLILKLLA